MASAAAPADSKQPVLSLSKQSTFNFISVDIKNAAVLSKQNKVVDSATESLSSNGYKIVSRPGVAGEDPAHITLLYGFDEKHYAKAKELTAVVISTVSAAELKFSDVYAVKSRHITGAECMTCDVKCAKLDALREQLVKLTGTVTSLPLHSTLLTVKRG